MNAWSPPEVTMQGNRFNGSTRRQWIGRLLAVAALPARVLRAGGASPGADPPAGKPAYPSTLGGGAPCGSCIAPVNLSSRTVIPESKEPGQPLSISGRIYRPDGVTPADGIVLFVYHTDLTGYYSAQDDASHPRLKGWMKTGADGRYEFRTIRPGAYPHRTTPAHIHAHLYGPGYSERSIDDYWFEDDPRINAAERAHARELGSTPFVVPLVRGGDGVWRGVRDIRMKPAS